MTTKKNKTEKTTPKNKNSGLKKPIETPHKGHFFRTYDYEIFKEGIYDDYGTIIFFNEDLPEEERTAIVQKRVLEDAPNYFTEYLDLLEKLESSSTPNRLDLQGDQHEVLKSALRLAFKCETEIEPRLQYLSAKLAWANNAIQDKSNSYEKNLREAGVRLGFTRSKNPKANMFPTGGKGKKEKFNSREVVIKYHELAEELNDSKRAILELYKTLGFNSPDDMSRYLRNYGRKNIPDFRQD
jgi:hypothetical protein